MASGAPMSFYKHLQSHGNLTFLCHWYHMKKALIVHKKLHASVTSTGLSFLLVRKESIHGEIMVDALVLEHPVTCQEVPR